MLDINRDNSELLNLPKKGLKVAHINICNLRNKVQEVGSLLHANNLHILAISESHLDQPFDDIEKAIQGYYIFRKDK